MNVTPGAKKDVSGNSFWQLAFAGPPAYASHGLSGHAFTGAFDRGVPWTGSHEISAASA
jgi:hypothetical protein